VVPPCFDSQTAQPVVGSTILYPALTGWPRNVLPLHGYAVSSNRLTSHVQGAHS